MNFTSKPARPGAVPTIFKFKPKISKARKAPLDRSNMPSSSRPVSNESSEEMEVELPETGNVPGCSNCACHEQEIEKLQKERSFVEEELHELRRENIYIKEELESLRTNSIYNFSNISSCPELFVKATGLEVKAFQDLFVFFKTWRKLQQH